MGLGNGGCGVWKGWEGGKPGRKIGAFPGWGEEGLPRTNIGAVHFQNVLFFFSPSLWPGELSKYLPQESHPVPYVNLSLNWAGISERAKALFLQYIFEKTLWLAISSPRRNHKSKFHRAFDNARKCRFQTFLSWAAAKSPGKGKRSSLFLGYLICLILFGFGLWKRTLLFRTLQSKNKNLPQNFARSLSILVLWLTDSNLSQ